MIKRYFSWMEIEEATKQLFAKIPFKPSAIVAVSRGGLIPGVQLSHLFQCRNFLTLNAVSYSEDNVQGKISVNMGWEAHVACLATDTIIVDDIIDTGNTFDVIDKKYPLPYKCALISKIPSPFHHVTRVAPDLWVEFPWEVSNDQA